MRNIIYNYTFAKFLEREYFMRTYKAQATGEIAIIGGVIFAVCALSVFTFGDQIGNVLAHNPVLSMFNGNRSQSSTDDRSLLSGVTVKIGESTYTSPVEDVLRKKLAQSVQTSGSSGNLTETMEVLEGYVTNLEALMTKLGLSSQAVTDALAAYNNAINEYKGLNGTPNEKLAKELDIATDLEVSGHNAVVFEEAMNNLIAQAPTQQDKDLLTLYKNGMLNIGGSLDYTVDSRLLKELGLQIYETSAKTKISELGSLIQNDAVESLLNGYTNLDGITGLNEIDKLQGLYQQVSDLIASYTPTTNQVGCTATSISRTPGTHDDIQINITLPSAGANAAPTLTIIADPDPTDHDADKLKVNGVQLTQVNFSDSDLDDYPQIADYLNQHGITSVNDYKIFKREIPGEAKKGYYFVKKSTFENLKAAYNADGVNGQSDFEIQSFTVPNNGANASNIVASEVSRETTTNISADALAKLTDIQAKLDEIYAVKRAATTALMDKLNNPNTADMSKIVTVYRNGTYRDILPDSYNNAAICSTLHLSPDSNGVCKTQ